MNGENFFYPAAALQMAGDSGRNENLRQPAGHECAFRLRGEYGMARGRPQLQHGVMSASISARDLTSRLSAILRRGLFALGALLATTVEECWFEEDRETRESLWMREPFF